LTVIKIRCRKHSNENRFWFRKKFSQSTGNTSTNDKPFKRQQ